MTTTLPIFTPSAPHGDPIAGYIDQNGNRCGDCVSVPRYWQIVGKGTPSEAYPNVPVYTQVFFNGPQILTRDVAKFQTDLSELCQWSCQVDLRPAGLQQIGSWTLFWSNSVGWQLWAQGGHFPDPIPPDLFVYSQLAFGAPDRRPFRCLDHNLFDLEPELGTGNFIDFPQTLTIQPYWA